MSGQPAREVPRQLILQMQMSADGFVGRRRGGEAWQVWDWGDDCQWDPALQERFNAFFETVDCVLLSRPMAPGYCAHWADIAARLGDSPTFAFTHRIEAARKIAFSRDGDSAASDSFEMADRSLSDMVGALRAQGGGTMVAFGGAEFAASLIELGLVDELEFYVNPAAIGEGLSAFPVPSTPLRLELLEATAYPCGIVVHRYRPVRAAKACA